MSRTNSVSYNNCYCSTTRTNYLYRRHYRSEYCTTFHVTATAHLYLPVRLILHNRCVPALSSGSYRVAAVKSDETEEEAITAMYIMLRSRCTVYLCCPLVLPSALRVLRAPHLQRVAAAAAAAAASGCSPQEWQRRFPARKAALQFILPPQQRIYTDNREYVSTVLVAMY